MQAIQSFPELLKLWPTISALAEDLGVKYLTARGWQQRGAVPAEYWLGLVASAEKRDIEGVTLELLAKLSAEQAGRTVAA